MKFYKLTGAGKLIEITEGEYSFVLEKAVLPDYHEELKTDKQGFNYKGIAYIALEN